MGMRSASWRVKFCTRCSSLTRSASICVRNSTFMLSLVNCALSSRMPPCGSRGIRSESGQDASLRPRTFEHDHIEDFDSVEPVALGLEELPPLVNCRVDEFVIVGGERNLGPVRLEEILVDVEAFAEGL